MSGDAPAGLAEAIAERAARAGVDLAPATLAALAAHARAVLQADPRLHLTTIRDRESFVERHLGEAFEGARLVEPERHGLLVDLGSGNGYPGIPLAAARPGLRALLVEASERKAAFLRDVLAGGGLPGAAVHGGQVQRAADLERAGPITVLATRAMGGWERIVPRLAPALEADGVVLVWAGTDAESVFRREAWSRFVLERRLALPGRRGSWVFRLRQRAQRRPDPPPGPPAP